MTDYPKGMTLRPLLSWPHAVTTNRPRSPFRSTWTDTIEVLDRELRHLKHNGPRWTAASYPDSVLQVALREQDFRLDGLPRANAIPTHPGVILNVESSKGPLSLPCDKFDRWQDNLRAIALGLEALRKVGRYGITPGDEQYVGWKALPQRGSEPALTTHGAERVLRDFVDDTSDDPTAHAGALAQVYRRAIFVAHPDRNGGDHARWDLVEAAAAVLRNAGRLQ